MIFGKNGKRIQNLKRDNRGSTIVMTLIAFFFVSVLVAIIMSTVVVNFRMRSIDRYVKDEFYYAEKALNDIYAGLGENCANALGDSYNKVMAEYTNASGSYQDQVMAYDKFCKYFLTDIYSDYDSINNPFGVYIKKTDKTDLKNKLNGYIVGDRAKVESIGSIKYLDSKRETASTDEDKYPSIKYTVLKNVKIVSNMDSVDKTGYMSGITVDIVIETPQIDFFTVNEKDLEYAIAANDGIEFNGDAVINGSVYGGARSGDRINDSTAISSFAGLLGHDEYMSDASDYGGILVNGSNVTINGEFVVSAGDVYVKKNGTNAGKLTISHGTDNEIWFDNLTVEGADSKVDIKGNLYAQGDLQIEGDNSEVKINGGYYGYNGGAFDSKTDYLKDDVGNSKANISSKYSSIIINSKDTSLDMTDVDTLVLLGKAFIDQESKRTSDTATSLEVFDGDYSEADQKDDNIGESVALKSGQQIFLCPTEFLNGKTNPCEFDDSGFDFTIDRDNMKKWFGWEYLNTTHPVRTVKLKKNGVNRAYCYLNFKGGNIDQKSESQRAYIETIVKNLPVSSTYNHEPKPATMKSNLIRSNRLQNSEITIGTESADDTRVYANGSVVQYKAVPTPAVQYRSAVNPGNPDDKIVDPVGSLSIKDNTTDFTLFGDSTHKNNMHYKYQRLCAYLDPMVSSINETEVSATDLDDRNLPFGRLFWKKGVDKISEGGSLCSKTNVGGSYEDYIKDCESTVIVCHGKDNGDAFYEGKLLGTEKYKSAVDICKVLDDNGNPSNVFMIIDGDAYIKDSVTINGFIYVNGELIVEKNATLNVTYNSTLLDRRIEAELKRLKQEYKTRVKTVDTTKPEDCYDSRTLIYYLLDYTIPKDGTALSPAVSGITDTNVDDHRKYAIDEKTGEVVNDVNADYTQFMYLENWRKGL